MSGAMDGGGQKQDQPRLPAIFREFGIVIPADYDKACFRCGKPFRMRGDEGGLCIDCHDACDCSDAGYEATVRSELAATRWYVQKGGNHWRKSLLPGIPPVMLRDMGVDPASVDLNPVSVDASIRRAGEKPEIACIRCGQPVAPAHGIIVSIDGVDHRIEYCPCVDCDATTIAMTSDPFTDGRRTWFRGPLSRDLAEAHWEMPGPCPTPGFSKCFCERHRFMLFLVEKHGWA